MSGVVCSSGCESAASESADAAPTPQPSAPLIATKSTHTFVFMEGV